jgi:hypothetical protein
MRWRPARQASRQRPGRRRERRSKSEQPESDLNLIEADTSQGMQRYDCSHKRQLTEETQLLFPDLSPACGNGARTPSTTGEASAYGYSVNGAGCSLACCASRVSQRKPCRGRRAGGRDRSSSRAYVSRRRHAAAAPRKMGTFKLRGIYRPTTRR